MPKNYFGERIAERYDESAADMFEPAQVDPVVDFLSNSLRTGPLSSSESAPVGSPCR